MNRSPSPSINDENGEYSLISNIPFKLNIPLDPLVGLQKHVEEFTKLSKDSSSSNSTTNGAVSLALEKGIIEKMDISIKEQKDFEDGIGSLLEDNEGIKKLSRQTYKWMTNIPPSTTKSIFKEPSPSVSGSGSSGNTYNYGNSTQPSNYGNSTQSSNYGNSTKPSNYGNSTQSSNYGNSTCTSSSNYQSPPLSNGSFSSINTRGTSSITTQQPVKNVIIETQESKARDLAQVYIPHETRERQESFTKIYLSIHQTSTSLTDFDILQAFIKFDADQSSSIKYLKNMQALKEMGFPEHQITSTLQIYPFDQEKALEEIFSKM